MNIALFGSGEFTDSVNEIDQYLIQQYGLKSVAVLPTAAGKERDYNKWLDLALSHYESLGIKVIPVPIIDTQGANDDKLISLLDTTDWIFFSGGRPDYLLSTLKGSKLWDKVIDKTARGALLTGSSAGAMIMGKYIFTNLLEAIFSNTSAAWAEAFGLVDYSIIPHYNKVVNHKNILLKIIDNGPEEVKASWIGIDEDTALIIDGSGSTIKGVGTVDFHTNKH